MSRYNDNFSALDSKEIPFAPVCIQRHNSILKNGHHDQPPSQAMRHVIRCINSGFIVELECSMRIQIPVSGPDEYLIVYRSRVTILRSERRKFPEASIVCP